MTESAFLQLSCGFSRTCRENRLCAYTCCEAVPCWCPAWICADGHILHRGSGPPCPTPPPAGQPWSPGRGRSSSPRRRLGALELVPEVTRSRRPVLDSPRSPDWSLGALFFPVSCLGLCDSIWLCPLPSQSACGFRTMRLERPDVSLPVPLPAAAALWNPDAVAHPCCPRWKPAGGLGGSGCCLSFS